MIALLREPATAGIEIAADQDRHARRMRIDAVEHDLRLEQPIRRPGMAFVVG